MDRGRLRERESTLAAITAVVDGARRGRGGAAFVVGHPGLGKTAVLEYACEQVDGRMELGRGRGDAMEEVVAFGLIDQLAGPLGQAERPEPAPVVEPSAPYHRVLRWLEARADRPLLLALDDLQWGDADSLALIAFLVRRLDRLPVALIATLRPWPPRAEELCRGLQEAGHATLERLAPLSRASATDLLAERAGVPVSDVVSARTWELCQGNPLLIEQVALALRRGEGLPAATAGVPALAEHLLLARFAGLDEPGLRCARAASVLGTTFRPEVAAEIADLPETTIDAIFDALFRSGLVVEIGHGEVRFAHPLFAQALQDDLAPPVRRRLHARAFTSLVARGLDREAAEHAVRADLVGDQTAIDVLERVGRAALAIGAVATAARHVEAAVRLRADQVPAELLLLLCEALPASGRMEDAAAACRRLLAEPDLPWSDRIEVLRMLGRTLYLTGAPDHGERVLEEAVAVACEHEPARAVQPLLDQSLSAWLAAGPARALPLAIRARELAQEADAELRERAEATWGHLALEAGDASGLAATEPIRRRLARGDDAQRLLDPGELTWPWASAYQYAMNANYAEDLEESEATFTRARDVVERAGAASAMANVAIHMGNIALRRGRLEAALGEATRAKEFSELTPGVVAYADLARAEALLWMGRAEESERFCSLAQASAPHQWFSRLWLAHVRGAHLLWQGDAGASAMFLLAEELTRSVGIREPCHMHWQGHAIAAHLAAGRQPDAERVVDWLEDCARALPCRWPRIAAAAGRAELAWRSGDDDEADRQFRSALALHGEVDLPLLRVECLLAYGGFLRRRGHPAEGRPPIAEALRLADAAGAAGLAETARRELAQSGGRRRRGRETRSQLTSAETRVADLAAQGHSNAEIARGLHLSVNTVETHLKHIYAKLGIRSRRQLMLDREH